MTQITPIIRLMTPEETRTTQLMNAGSIIDYDGTTIAISAGREDKVHVYKDSTVIYVLSINYRHEYIGLEVFDSTSGEEYVSIFLQYQWELIEYIGASWKLLPPLAIVRRLIDHLI
jgi:hypothetical protein